MTISTKEQLMMTAPPLGESTVRDIRRGDTGRDPRHVIRSGARRSVRQSGFSLIELMIAVVVVSILAAVAWPAYTDYTRKANRSAAQQLLLEIATKQSQYILDARGYIATIGANGLNISRDGWTCAATCTNSYYTVSVTIDNTATPPSFTATGTPISTSIQASDGILNYTNLGTKTRMVGGADKGW